MIHSANFQKYFRVVFNAKTDEPQKLIIRSAGIEPGSENDVHYIEAETEASYEGISNFSGFSEFFR